MKFKINDCIKIKNNPTFLEAWYNKSEYKYKVFTIKKIMKNYFSPSSILYQIYEMPETYFIHEIDCKSAYSLTDKIKILKKLIK
jgi:hypothetical protein